MRTFLLCLLASCAAPRGSFSFVLAGDVNAHVGSAANVAGHVNDAGYLVLDDNEWNLTIDLAGLAPGSHAIDAKNGELALVHDTTGDFFTTMLGGTCTVLVDPHTSKNGDPVSGKFFCTGLVSNTNKHVDITSGAFRVYIDDEANNPNLNAPSP